MNTLLLSIVVIICIYLLVYAFGFFILHSYVWSAEKGIIDIFLGKVNKIPALIEVMRPYVANEEAFGAITAMHSEVMIYRHDSIYDLLEYNAKIQNQFLFLMRLSVQIPELQKQEYFLYIRDFIIRYERDMELKFARFNFVARLWNRFVFIKNITLIGLILPGMKKQEILR